MKKVCGAAVFCIPFVLYRLQRSVLHDRFKLFDGHSCLFDGTFQLQISISNKLHQHPKFAALFAFVHHFLNRFAHINHLCAQLCRVDQMDLIILHKVQKSLILNRHHLMEQQRPIPFVCAKVQHKGDDGRNFIFLIEAGEVFAAAMPFCVSIACTMLDGNIGHLFAGGIRLNLLTERVDVTKAMGWSRSGSALTDTDFQYILRRMEQYGLTSDKKVRSALSIAANENRYHPIRDWLNGLVWDGRPRMRQALHHFLGAAESDYTEEALRLFLPRAICRVFKPGCKFETMLCLVGGQAAGKSTFFRLLAVKDEWFMTCGGWTMTTCIASCKVTGSSKCPR